jgi:hypothetical protein
MIRDTRMAQKALEQRWPIKPEYREALVRRLVRIIADPNSSAREVTSASKALIAAESQNQADEHKVVDVRLSTRNDQLDAIATDLGIEVSVVIDAERKGIGSNISDEEYES